MATYMLPGTTVDMKMSSSVEIPDPKTICKSHCYVSNGCNAVRMRAVFDSTGARMPNDVLCTLLTCAPDASMVAVTSEMPSDYEVVVLKDTTATPMRDGSTCTSTSSTGTTGTTGTTATTGTTGTWSGSASAASAGVCVCVFIHVYCVAMPF